MQCEEVRHSLSRGEIPAGAEDHLLSCESCGALLVRRLGEQRAFPDPDLGSLFAGVQADIASERGLATWLRSRATKPRKLLAISAAVLLTASVAILVGRSDIGALPTRAILAAVVYAIAFLAVLTEALRPLHQRQHAGLRRGFAWATLATPMVIAELSAGAATELLLAGRSSCLLIGLVVGLSLLWVLKSLEASAHRSGTSALLAVAAAGLVANLALILYCPSNSPAHLVRTHAPAGLVLAFGYFGARRLLRGGAEARRS